MTKRGLLPVFLWVLSLAASVTMAQDNTLYHEPYRPQYHFSPPCGWMNDPNGMVYYQGEYHFFYQYSPQVNKGRIHWGHAVSPDLVHWQNLPIALYPDDMGDIWSGSAVVDIENTSGLVPGGGLVAIFSYENQSQGIAYSTDRGRTWTKYKGNPVLPAIAKDFRDPKVFWYGAEWTMVIAAGHEIQIFTSPNLLDWTLRSHFSGGQVQPIWEVPDLFPLQIDGKTKWVLLVSQSAMAPAGGNGIQYFIGDFDGYTFSNDNPDKVLWLDYGTDNYAGTTWNNMDYNHRVYIGWMSNWQTASSLPTPNWRGAATLPRDLKLVRTADGIRLAQMPVASLAQLRTPVGTWDNLDISGDHPLDNVHGRTLEIIAEFEAGTAQRFGIDVHRGDSGKTRLVYNTAQSQLLVSRPEGSEAGTIPNFTTAFGAPIPLDNGHLRLHLFVDESSVETFAQDGLITLSAQTFGSAQDDGVALFADKGDAKLVHLEIYSLASIWSHTEQVPAGIECS